MACIIIGGMPMEYITAKEAAKKWGITQRRVQILCTQERIPGAKRHGWMWMIPADAEKPYDARRNHKDNQVLISEFEK